MSTAQLGRVRHARPGSLLFTALTGALLLAGMLPDVATATSFAVRASVSSPAQYLNDTTGTTLLFTVKNTGYPTRIGAVQISRPFSAWTITGCPTGPAGWTRTGTSSQCTYASPTGPTGDIAPGASATFSLVATTAPGNADRKGTWKVIASKTSTFSGPSNLVQAGAMGAGLKTKAYSFEVLSAIVSATPATPGAACPAGATSAPAASTGNYIVICGRNRSTAARKPNAAHSSLSGTFIASHGAFSSASIAPSTTSRVLGNWANVTITSASGAGKTIIAKIGRLSQQSPPTTLTGFNALNSPPVVTTSSGSLAYTENDPATAIDPGLTVSDPDDTSLVAANVRISAGFSAAQDTLGFTNQNGITGSYNGATGMLMLTGSATVADYQTALRSVTYQNSSDNPTTSRSIAFSASDVHAFGAEATKSITITAVNDAPTITSSGPTTATEDTLYTYDATSSDPDGPGATWTTTGADTCAGTINPTSGEYTFTPAGPTPPASCVVGIQVADGGSPNETDTQNTTVTITAVNDAPEIDSTAPTSATEDTLYTYDATAVDPDGTGQAWSTLGSDTCGGTINPTSGEYTFTPAGPTPPASCVVAIQVCDAGLACDSQSTTVTITAVNDAPVLDTTATPLAYIDGDGAVAIDPGITASDPDSANLSGATISITSGYNAGEDTLAFANTATITVLSNTGGVLTLTGTDTVANYQAALRSVTYANSATHVTPVQRVVTFQVTDSGAAPSNQATRTINISPPNAAPVAQDQGPVTVAEDASVGITLTATDADDDNLIFSIVAGPTKGSLGSIGTPDCSAVDTCTASVLYTTTANLNGSDSFTFKVNDGTVDSNTATVSISITPVNDAPVLDASKSPALAAENEDAGLPSGAVGTLVSDLVDFATPSGQVDNVTDADNPGALLGIAVIASDTAHGAWWYSVDNGIHWLALGTVSDSSARLLAANSNNRLYFAPSANFNGTLASAITFRAWDQTTGTDGFTGDASTNGGTTAFSSASDTASLVVNAVNDAPSFTKGADQLNKPNQDSLNNGIAYTVAGWATAISAGPPDESGQVLTFHVSNDNNALFTVQPAVNASNGNLTFTTDPTQTGSTTVSVYLTDDGGTANGGSDTSATQTFTITTVLPAPIAVDDPASTDYAATGGVPIDIASGMGVTQNDTLYGGSITSYGKTTGLEDSTLGTATATAQGGFVTLNADGSFHYDPPATPPGGGTDTFVYTLSNSGGSDTATVTIGVTHQIIFINASASSSPETGSLDHPYNSLGDVPSGRNTGGVLFFYSGTYTRSDAAGVTLKSSESLIGQGVALSSNLPFTLAAHSVALPGASTNPTISTTLASSNAVTLGSGNTVKGVTLGAALGADLFGLNFGTLTISNTTINNTTTGSGLVLDTGAIASGSTLDALSASPSGSAPGVTFSTVTGSLTISGGSIIANTSAPAVFAVSGGSVSVTDSGSISQAGTGALIAATGGHTGTLIFQTGTLSATSAGGLGFTNADGTYTLSAGASLSGGGGVAITAGSSGTITLNNTSITNATGTAFDVDGSNATVSESGAISKTNAGSLVVINANTGGSVALSGNLSATTLASGISVTGNSSGTYTFSASTKTINTAANPAVTLTSNAGATVNFTGGGLAITTTSGAGFKATGGATALNVTGTGNTISSGSGTALDVENSTIGGSGLTFQSVSASGGSHGIVLDTTGTNAGLTVTGNSSAGTGGTINGITGADLVSHACATVATSGGPVGVGVFLNSTKSPSLSYINFTGTFGNFGILGYGVSGSSTFDHLGMTGTFGDDDATDDSTVGFCGLTGSATLSNSTIQSGAHNNIYVINDGGSLNRLTMSNDTVGLNQTNGGLGTLIEACIAATCGSATTLNATVTDSTFQGARGTPVAFIGQANSTMDVVFGQPGHGNAVHNTHANVAPGTEDFDASADGSMTFDVNSNHFDTPNTTNTQGGVFINAAEDQGNMSGYFRNNTIGNSGVTNSGSAGQANALDVESNNGGDMTIDIDSNQIYQFNGALGTGGVWVIPHGATSAGSESTVFNMTFTNNTVAQQGTANASPNQIQGFQLDNETQTADNPPNGEAFTTCLKFASNTINGAGSGGAGGDVRLRQRFNTKVDMPGYLGTAGDTSAVDSYIQGLNPTGPPSVSSTASTGGTPAGGFFNTPGGAACALPSF